MSSRRITPSGIIKQLETVTDPELGADIVSLGLVYDARVDGKTVLVRMTMTMPLCPLEEYFREQVQAALKRLPGVETINVDFVFEPAWTPQFIASHLRSQLGFRNQQAVSADTRASRSARPSP